MWSSALGWKSSPGAAKALSEVVVVVVAVVAVGEGVGRESRRAPIEEPSGYRGSGSTKIRSSSVEPATAQRNGRTCRRR